ncbi:TspO/MBR family protein [Lyngbya confervoides]|uniref:Tryptophan-rich sensory protein n=1 Tax=Lyngbya confervoides BDU141951 TaxID=1574623 RepID=A0ABD4T2R1_9CYAN|nr:tryptophan-rich sensory protein [Lyngbya confervoides]MCM1982944.1 tryptophan-rich sensory protein [Lyngbya confervoides BDU141951]
MQIPSWLAIAGVAIAIFGLVNRQSAADRRWFFRLKRPRWLSFEPIIPVIWTVILICGVWSAYLVWEASQNAGLMGLYALLEVLIMGYNSGMGKMRSLWVGVWIGAAGFLVGVVTALGVAPVSGAALGLLMPYLIWSPVGTFVTWKMIHLNPEDA